MITKHLASALSVIFLSSSVSFSQQKKVAAPTKPGKPAAAAVTAPPADPIIMNISGKDITKSEFQSIYNKNNNVKEAQNNKSLDDYIQLFVNFKLKVKEAEEMGLDTLKSFKDELEGYRKQLAQPYLVDNEVNEKLIKEAYDRMKFDVKASHILFKCDASALPKDTLAAYNKAIDARNKILKGEKFADLAKKLSDDPSAKENGGDLGFFTSMQMVYPFESACFNAKVGDISMPVRTRFGYHILKVEEKRAAQGSITTAHIMVIAKKGASVEDSTKARKKIFEIYDSLKAGKSFSELAQRYSDDKNSAKKGGELPAFSTGRMVPEFEKAAFALANNGDYTQPVLTQYGWHIIKRVSKKDIASFDEMKQELKQKISKDSRSQKSKESMIAKIKKEYNFKDDAKAKMELNAVVDSNFFNGSWKATAASKLNKNLMTIGTKTITQSDFAKYIENHQTKRTKTDIAVVMDELYKAFVTEQCLAYEETQLARKYADYRQLMQEYRDGILLFDLTDKKVWSKAVKDTTGLRTFYDANKSKYMWDERTEATVYSCKNDSVANAVRELLNPKPAEGGKKKKKEAVEPKPMNDDDILGKLNKTTQLNLRIENNKFSKGDNEAVDKCSKTQGLSENMNINKQVVFVKVVNTIAPEPKSLSEAKGLVTNDYQNVLEKEWIDSLRSKYKFELKQDVLNTLR
jgi:peptidyl-prolyl cis-trans isomerase SurA